MSLTELTGRTRQDKTREKEPARTALLLFLCSAVCCGSGQSGPGAGGDECPAPLWVQFNTSCYTFVYLTHKSSLSIEPARELCKDIGADIISINTKEENAFLLKTFQTKWKGSKEVLLGMFYDSDDDSLKWFDKSEVTFLNWRQGQISNENLNTCLKMSTLTGLWDVTDCDNFTESAVLCKTTLNTSKENKKTDKRIIIISFISAFTILVLAVSIVVLVLHKRRIWSSGFTSRHLQGAAQVLPYRDDAVLVDTMEREDYA